MSFSDIIQVRKGVLASGGVSGIVDMENLRDPTGKREMLVPWLVLEKENHR